MRRREQQRKTSSPRDDISLILELPGLGPLVAQVSHTTTGTALFVARWKIRMMAAMIPAAVCLALAADAAGAVALAMRRARTSGGSEHGCDTERPRPHGSPIDDGPRTLVSTTAQTDAFRGDDNPGNQPPGPPRTGRSSVV